MIVVQLIRTETKRGYTYGILVGGKKVRLFGDRALGLREAADFAQFAVAVLRAAKVSTNLHHDIIDTVLDQSPTVD